MQSEVELRRLESEEKQLQENPPKNLESSLEAKKTGFFSGLFQKKESTSSQKKSLREQYLSLAERLNKTNLMKAAADYLKELNDSMKEMKRDFQRLNNQGNKSNNAQKSKDLGL